MADLVAHRDERRVLGINFANNLPAGATIASVDLITFLDAAGTDVTAEFRGGTPAAHSVNGSVVNVWKEKAASANDQKPGTYRWKVRVTLSNAEEPIALNSASALARLKIVGD